MDHSAMATVSIVATVSPTTQVPKCTCQFDLLLSTDQFHTNTEPLCPPVIRIPKLSALGGPFQLTRHPTMVEAKSMVTLDNNLDCSTWQQQFHPNELQLNSKSSLVPVSKCNLKNNSSLLFLPLFDCKLKNTSLQPQRASLNLSHWKWIES